MFVFKQPKLCDFASAMSVGGEDLYKILGVNRNALPAEIKKSYHKLALKVHPDKINHNEPGGQEEEMVCTQRASNGLQGALQWLAAQITTE